MIDLRIAHLTDTGQGTLLLDGTQNELTTLLGKLYSSYGFDPSLKSLISREQVLTCKETLQRVSEERRGQSA